MAVLEPGAVWAAPLTGLAATSLAPFPHSPFPKLSSLLDPRFLYQFSQLSRAGRRAGTASVAPSFAIFFFLPLSLSLSLSLSQSHCRLPRGPQLVMDLHHTQHCFNLLVLLLHVSRRERKRGDLALVFCFASQMQSCSKDVVFDNLTLK
uniref:Uncharacterized protein n=1 Tax=Physcomitrium patens TaxID=3218 RepID=A0A2K1JDA2_PHYPA|nr:hypothetical protein PHYPA_019783 [Physcomitrium patens]